jgi:hypothetical protein
MASSTIRELLTRLGFQVDTKNLTKYEKTISRVKKTLAGIVSAYAIRQLYNVTKDLVTKTVEYYDELGESAQKLGVNAQSLQKLRYSAGIAGVGVEQLGTGIKLLSKNMEAARGGSKEVQKAFAAVGIKDLSKFKTTEEVMFAISQSVEKMPEGSKKVALMLKLFGRSGSELIPMLNNSKELREQWDELSKAGGLATDEQLKYGDKMDKAFRKAEMQVEVLKRSIGYALLPEVEKITKEFSSWIVSDDAKNFVKDLSGLLVMMTKVAGFLGMEFKAAAESANDLWNPKEGWFRKWKALPKGAVTGGLKDAGKTALTWMSGKGGVDYLVNQYKQNKAAEEQRKQNESFKGFYDELTGKDYKNATTVILPNAPGQKGIRTKTLYEGELGGAPEDYGLAGALTGQTPLNAPVAPAVDKSTKTMNVTYQNKFDIKTEGMSPEMVQQVVGDAVKDAQEKGTKTMQTNFPR